MAPLKLKHARNMLMELRKVCQHPYLSAPELENEDLPETEQHKQLVEASGKLAFLKILLPKLKDRGHRVLLFSQFKIALDMIEDFLVGEGLKYLRLDGDVQQAQRQKSMDQFNAPGSEYFIFLLTTRAGGVGINLATADTVIIYDPDFNPHQDLQAIARSHRYGQKKQVLVFKLMVKDTVEERIIAKTKKKLVLDHLIVQSMKEEHEEGEIDDMILHGAKALYEADAEGRSATDIIYNSKNVDELIDRVEQEANEEAKAMEQGEEDKAKRLASGEEAAEGQTKAKDGMSFGFAKIWEAGENGLAEVPEEEEGQQGEEKDVEDQTTGWEAVMLNARAAEAKRKADEEEARQQRLRRQNQVHQYQPDGMLSDDSPQARKIKKGKGKKGKGKATKDAADSSDAEFAPGAAGASESEGSIDNYSDEAEALVGPDGRPIVIPGSKDMMQWQATKDAQRAAALGHIQSSDIVGASGPVAGPSTFPLPPPNAGGGSSRQGRLIETPEQRAERKARKEAEKQAIRDEAKRRFLEAERNRHLQQTQSHPGPPAVAIPPSAGPSVNHINHNGNGDAQSTAVHVRPGVIGGISNQSTAGSAIRLVDAAVIDEAQQILQWLWAMLERLGFKSEKSRWAEMALPELHTKERTATYIFLAKVVDQRLSWMGQDIVFLRPETQRKVARLFELRQPAIPDWSSRELEHLPILPIPEGAGTWKSGVAPSMAASASVGSPLISQMAPTTLPATQGLPRTMATAVARPPPAAGSGVSSLAGPITTPISVPRLVPSPASVLAAGSSSTAPPRDEPTSTVELAPSEAARAAQAAQAGPSVIHATEMIEAGPSRSPAPAPAPAPAPVLAPQAVPPVCPHCEGTHNLAGCPTVPSLVDLITVRGAILDSDEPDEVVAESLAALDDILRQYQAEGHDVSAILGMQRKPKRAVAVAAVPDSTPRDGVENRGSAVRPSSARGPEASPAARTRLADSSSAARDTLPVTPSAIAATTAARPTPAARVNGHAAHAPVTPSRGSREAAIVVDDDSDANMETEAEVDGYGERSSKRPRIESSSRVDDSGSLQRESDLTPARAQKVAHHHPTWVADNPLDHQDEQPDAQTQSQTQTYPQTDALRLVPANEPVVTPRKGRPRTFLGCNICGNQRFHPAAQCPVVIAGPASISVAMRNFSPKDPLYCILSQFLNATNSNSQPHANSQSLANTQSVENSHIIADTQAPASSLSPTCAYCATQCDRPVRDCAEVHGGRLALKRLIRRLDQEREEGQWGGDREGMMEKRMGELYDLYQAWPK